MGYELTRFIGEIDEEFQCSICTMVLKDPVQTPCEHSFCNECIKDWLAINQTCPVDREPLKISDLKPPSRPFRNLWNKLDIKCDFQPQGCSSIIKLENLGVHVVSCEYNSVVVCDKGCNLRITPREYEIDNCYLHLSNRVIAQQKEITKLRHLLSDQRDYFERIVNGLKEENRQLNGETRGDESRRFVNDEASRLDHFRNVISQKQHTVKLKDKSNISLMPLKWQFCDNVVIEQSNILKILDPSRKGFVHSDYSLEPGKSSFKVHALRIENLNSSIGLSLAFGSIFYCGSGSIHADDVKLHIGAQWERGDTIECGIKFPTNFISDGNHRATVYFNRNEESIFEKSIKIPKYIFPTVYIYGRYTRLQYYQQL